MTRALATRAVQQRCEFLVNGQRESAVLLLGSEVFLPVVAFHAELLARSLADFPLGVRFSEDDQALLGVSVSVPHLTGDEVSVMRLAFFSDALTKIFGVAHGARIECAPVFQAYQDGLLNHVEKSGTVKWPMAQVSLR